MAGRTLALTVVAIFVAGALAGCLGGGPSGGTNRQGVNKLGGTAHKVWTADDKILSQPIYTKILHEALPVTASDGIKLDNWLFRPETPADVKIPAIVHLSPYFGASLPAGGGGLEKILRENFTARGYAVVSASVRGTGFSGGCFEIGGPREREDYNEVFAAIAKQPWSNGNIAAIGVSYDGTAPQGALVAASPFLKTIVPIAAISEWYKYNFVKGVQINPQGYAFNAYYVGQESAVPNLHPGNAPVPFDPMMLPQDIQTFSTRACPAQGGSSGPTRGPSVIDVQRAQAATAMTGTTDPYWEDRNFTKLLDKVRSNVSVLVVHGLIDYNVKTHNLMPWIPELEAHGVPVKILLGQWPHAYPGTVKPNGRADWNLTLLRWFDYWLKGIDTGIMNEPRADIQGSDRIWHQEDNFPPSRVNQTTFYFDQGGKLGEKAGTGSTSFVDDGTAYTPSSLPGGVANPNAVAYLMPKNTHEFRYSGMAVAHVELSHTAPRGQIAITVYNVTGSTWTAVNWGYYNYNIRNKADAYDPVVPGQHFTLEVPLLPTDMVIPAGSQVAVVLAGASDALNGPNVQPPPSGGSTTVFHGAKTSITFPMLDGITPMYPQPKMTGK